MLYNYQAKVISNCKYASLINNFLHAREFPSITRQNDTIDRREDANEAEIQIKEIFLINFINILFMYLHMRIFLDYVKTSSEVQ